jgi:hypothetical protein
MIKNLKQVQDSYTITDKTHGTVTFGPKQAKWSTENIAYVMLNAKGDVVKNLTDPHITIWGKNHRSDAWIASVEFSWAGARHVYFNLFNKKFSTPHIPSGDEGIAKTLELLLAQFLNLAQIASITVTQAPTASSLSKPNDNNTPPPSVNPKSDTYASDWPSLG